MNFENSRELKNKSVLLAVTLSVFLLFFSLSLLINTVASAFTNLKTPCNVELQKNYLNNGLVLYFKFNNEKIYGENESFICDFSGFQNHGTAQNVNWSANSGVKKSGAFNFNQKNQVIKIKDSAALSPSAYNGSFTVAFYVKFKNTSFIGTGSGKNYVHYLGKGTTLKQGYEWTFRQYNASNSENRNNRLSFYTFNLEGGLGAGSYVQEHIHVNEWIHLTGVINGTHIKLYKNGQLKSVNSLEEYKIQTKNSNSDVYIGSIDNNSYFNGTIDELRIYNHSLTDEEVKQLYENTK